MLTNDHVKATIVASLQDDDCATMGEIYNCVNERLTVRISWRDFEHALGQLLRAGKVHEVNPDARAQEGGALSWYTLAL